MKMVNEVRRQRLASRAGIPVDGLVQVRGIDLRVGSRGFLFERQDPLAVIVTDGQRESRHEMPREPRVPRAAMLAAPIAAFVLARLFSSRRRN